MKNNEKKQLKDNPILNYNMVVDYSQGKIYKIEPICSHDEGDVYIGSTSIPRLCNRLSGHKEKYNAYNNQKEKKRTSSFDLFDKYGAENCQIILIENVNAKTKDELRAREHYHITNTKCVNVSIPFLGCKSYENKKEWNCLYHKSHYTGENRIRALQQKKEYRLKNKEIIKEKKKEYREKIKDKLSEQHQCQCGGHYTITHKQRHLKSTKHIQFEETNAGI